VTRVERALTHRSGMRPWLRVPGPTRTGDLLFRKQPRFPAAPRGHEYQVPDVEITWPVRPMDRRRGHGLLTSRIMAWIMSTASCRPDWPAGGRIRDWPSWSVRVYLRQSMVCSS
jgi:hypothetical protein